MTSDFSVEIDEYFLPDEFVFHSKGRLMEDIVSFNGNKIHSIQIDKNLSKYMEEFPELRNLFDKIVTSKQEKFVVNFLFLETCFGVDTISKLQVFR